MKILIIGATGATGQWLLQDSLAQGHQVTAFVRTPGSWQAPAGVKTVQGDARDQASLEAALEGQDAVLSALGPRSMKLDDLQEAYMRNLVAAMRAKGVKRLVNLSALGAGDSLAESPFFMRHILLPLMLKHVFADKNRGESLLLASDIDFVNVRPGRLLNSPARGGVKAMLRGQGLKPEMTRQDLSKFMVAQLTENTWLRQSPLIGY
jgi:putative NADH-flavin reductase